MYKKTIHYTSIVLKLIEKTLGSNFSVSGVHNIPHHPTLFVANHFTRCETFFLPYLIYKNTGRHIRCLADSSLYHGLLGNFLESAGTLSTKDEHRDEKIIRDLVKCEYDWMIYPEGSMLKSKDIISKRVFINATPSRVGPVRTGAAVLGLKSQLYRQDIIDAHRQNDLEVLEFFKKNFNLEYHESLETHVTNIVPVTISYYPIRPGENKIQKFISKIVKDIPNQIAEELEIEGNLLLKAEINISFGSPIALDEYIKDVRNNIYKIPLINNEAKSNLVLKYFKNRLTSRFMSRVYNDIQINLDHIFSSTISHFGGKAISISRLKKIIYYSGVLIGKYGKFRINSSLIESNLLELFSDEDHKAFDSAFKLAIEQGLITKPEKGVVMVKKDIFTRDYDFHQVRIKNSLRVIANEFFIIESAYNIVKNIAKIPEDQLSKRVFEEICNFDLEIYNQDYQHYFDDKVSKEKSVGSPFVVNIDKIEENHKVGIVLVHGYKSAPKEVESLAHYLGDLGYIVYAVRLKGHGTAPINIKHVKWRDWYSSTERGYCALNTICDKILYAGFSTGGLLSLLACSRKANAEKLVGIVSINSALRIRDIRSHLVPGINLWNDILDKFKIEKGQFDYIDNYPENPDINYSRNYLKGVEELDHLMGEVEKNMKKINNHILIIQGNHDPIVNPESAKIIYNDIKNSVSKKLIEVERNNHVIITGEGRQEIFDLINEFLTKLNLLK